MMGYSGEFKRDAVVLVRQRGSQRQVGRDLGVLKSVFSEWVSDADRAEQGLLLLRDVTLVEDARIRELIKRNRLLEQENEVLRRAAANLRRFISRPQNSVPARPRDGRDWRLGEGAGRGGVPGVGVQQAGVLPVVKQPVSAREREDDEEGGYQVLADDIRDLG